MIKSVESIITLARPLSNIKNIALLFLAFYLSKAEFNWVVFLASFFSVSFICSAFYIFNALFDYSIDRHNKNKKHFSEAVEYFGHKNSFGIFLILLVLGFLLGLLVNIYFIIFLLLLSVNNFLYSYQFTRFKNKFILDILFGATFTFAWRFCAFWVAFSYSLPPLLVLLVLVLGKSAGYLLYKDLDYKYLQRKKIKNSITILGKEIKIVTSIFLLFGALLSFIFLCVNHYWQVEFLGDLPPIFLFLIIFFIPPILIIYLSVLGKIKTQVKTLRIWSLVYWFFVITIFWLFL
jgi:4-hydroxybenzoate polyprenyltransferase